MGYEAIHLYERIPEKMKNEISHICVLNACSHSGLIEQARIIFDKISTKTTYIITTMVCLWNIHKIKVYFFISLFIWGRLF